MNMFDRLCGSATGPVGIAVSGGGDSLALLLMAREWAAERGRGLAAFTVDHRLRPEAAREAAMVASLCAELGIGHQTLVWEAPLARQAAARRARHALMATALKAQGGNRLLLGHTEDDQCETFLMRARQGSAWYGLAGMQPLALSPVWPEGHGVLLARPVLGLSRAALRDVLARAGRTWVDDPSNQDPVFERVRARRVLAGRPELRRHVLACQTGLQQLRRLEERLIGRWMRDQVRLDEAGALHVTLAGLSEDRAGRALGLLIQVMAGREAPPRRDGLAPLTRRLLAESRFDGASLGGTLISRRGGQIRLVAEPGVAREPPDPALLKARLAAISGLFCGDT